MKRGMAILLLAVVVTTAAGCTRPVTTVRVLSYNIHHGEGTDGVVGLPRIATVIRSAEADLVALQEVDRGVARTGGVDQPARLAELTGMHVVFERNITYQGGDYGNAVLSRYPIVRHANHHYPQTRPREQRGALAAEVRIEGKPVVFVATHLDYHADDTERRASVALLEELVAARPEVAWIVAGDFNATPESPVMAAAGAFLADAWASRADMQARQRDAKPTEAVQTQEAAASEVGAAGLTYPADAPTKRIDYVLFDRRRGWRCAGARVLDVPVASDHRPLLAVLERPK